MGFSEEDHLRGRAVVFYNVKSWSNFRDGVAAAGCFFSNRQGASASAGGRKVSHSHRCPRPNPAFSCPLTLPPLTARWLDLTGTPRLGFGCRACSRCCSDTTTTCTAAGATPTPAWFSSSTRGRQKCRRTRRSGRRFCWRPGTLLYVRGGRGARGGGRAPLSWAVRGLGSFWVLLVRYLYLLGGPCPLPLFVPCVPVCSRGWL